MPDPDENAVEYVAHGKCFAVALTRKVSRALQKVEVNTRASLERWMRVYADDGADGIPGNILKSEGRQSALGTNYLIMAFRIKTIRLYGGQLATEPLFLVTELDDKRQQKADQACLQRAAKYLAEYAARRKGGR